MGSMSARKGRRGEQEVANILRQYGIPARPGDPMNFGSQPDVVGTPWHPEIKRCERWELRRWAEQAEHDAQAMHDGVPIVIFRANRTPWRVCLKLEDFLQIYKELQSKRGPP